MNGNNVSANMFWQNVANGTLPAAAACPAPVPIAVPTGLACQSPAFLGATGPSAIVDPLALDLGHCGLTSFKFRNNGSTSEEVEVFFTGIPLHCVDHLICSSTTVTPFFESAGFVTSDVNGSFVGGEEGEQIQCFDELAGFTTIFATTLTFKAQDQASADAMSNAEVKLFTIDIASNFKVCEKILEANICSPCVSSANFDPIVWNLGVIPVGSTGGFSIVVPAGVAGRFDICIAGVDRGGNVLNCAIPVATCANY